MTQTEIGAVSGLDSIEAAQSGSCWYLYILGCRDGSLYTGITTDVPRRFAAHAAGKGAKYTKGRGPLKLLYQERLGDHSTALRREMTVKALRKGEKLRLIQASNNDSAPDLNAVEADGEAAGD